MEIKKMMLLEDVLLTLFLQAIIQNIYRVEGHAANMDELSALRESLLHNYDKYVIPINNHEPVIVSVYIYINDMIPLDNTPKHFTIDAYMRLEWMDTRLAFKNNSNLTQISFDHRMLSQIWRPALYFVQSKKGYKHNMLEFNALATLYKDGTVLTSERLSMSSFCNMNMKFYPFDIQVCQLNMEPYAFNNEYIVLKWEQTKGVSSTAHLHTIDFSQVEYSFNETTVSYGKLGTFSSLTIEFRLFRNLALYILRDFFPCMLIVCLSWVAFWINYKVTPARVAFAITTVLTIVTLTNNVKASSPLSSKFRSIDYYLLFCQLFVFGALAECAVVGMANSTSAWEKEKRKEKEKENRNKSTIKQIMVQPVKRHNTVEDLINNRYRRGEPSNNQPTLPAHREENSENKKTAIRKITKFGPILFENNEAHIVDRISRIIFPLTFVLMNIVYFAFHRLHPDTVN